MESGRIKPFRALPVHREAQLCLQFSDVLLLRPVLFFADPLFVQVLRLPAQPWRSWAKLQKKAYGKDLEAFEPALVPVWQMRPFALRVRPWLIFVFASLAAVAVARLALLDLTGGFFLVLAVVMGYLAIRKGMNIAWLLCLAMILFLNSLLDGFLVWRKGMNIAWLLCLAMILFLNSLLDGFLAVASGDQQSS
ncbi:hypothetical protein AK812_SmicGene29200 [Symbiodinium microadriaticum]|uniref:Uncharacterized protein n=1 Tax=Symbiodinium microadriaticum TaxID=2951 RepID=A0A1Q9D2H7_SYMMI|nr:hypothetical protein AK812_SmicGene29200 [Symbiodinium microadriaticum]